MTELQATIEFAVELCRFYNIDLYQRGFYRIRTELKVPQKLSVKLETSIRRYGKDCVSPAFVENNAGVSKTFRIVYRKDEVALDDIIVFRAHVLVDSNKIEDILDHANFCLLVELWFTNQSLNATKPPTISCVSTRTLHLQFTCGKGLHYHLPVIFDYFYLSAVAITIHASLIALHQPYIKKGFLHYVQSCTSRGSKPWLGGNSRKFSFWLPQSTVDNMFSNRMSGTSMKCISSNGMQLTNIQHMHNEVCSLLLNSYEALRSTVAQYSKLLPPWQRKDLKTSDNLQYLHNLDYPGKLSESLEEFVTKVNNEIAQLCAENILLWQQFLDTFGRREAIRQYLAKQHHQLRVKRFAEAFFLIINPRQSAGGCFDLNYQNYINISEDVRRSRYWLSLPMLPVYCVELDGDLNTIPIIFEEKYEDIAEFARKRSEAGRHFIGDIKRIEKIGTQEDCSCGIAEILESRSQRSFSEKSNSLKKREKKSNREAEDISNKLRVKSSKHTSSMEYLLRNTAILEPSLISLESQLSLPPNYSHYRKIFDSQCVCYQPPLRNECYSQYDMNSVAFGYPPPKGYANTLPLPINYELRFPNEERPYPRKTPKDKRFYDREKLIDAHYSSGYHTDVRYPYEESNVSHYATYRNSRNVLAIKNGTSKSDNVDAYFVDTLNKSMADDHNMMNIDQATQSTDQLVPSVDKGISIGNEEYLESSRIFTPSKSSPLHKSDSSSDSCGSSFIPVRSSRICRSAPYDLDSFLCEKPARSSSMCSMTELVNCAVPPYIINSESMPNITGNRDAKKFLYASQLNSPRSLSESDDMSERSGYVSSRKSSAGSTNQVTPTGQEIGTKSIQKLVSCDALKEKLDKLVNTRQRKTDLLSNSKNMHHKKIESIQKETKHSNKFTNEKSTLDQMSSSNIEENHKSKPNHVIAQDPHPTRDFRNANVRRSESWQGNAKYQRARHSRMSDRYKEHLKNIPNLKPRKSLEPQSISDTVEVNSNEQWDKPSSPLYAEISRNDPKRITKRYISRNKPMLEDQNNHQDYEKVDLLPPCQFRDAPPPPEAFRDPPEPIDNLLYYVVESVNENREANRRKKYGEEFKKDKEEWKKDECVNPYKIAEYVQSYVNPEDITFGTEGNLCDMDADLFDKLKYFDIYDKNSEFNKYKEEFKQHINFSATLYSDFPTLASTLPYFHLSEEYRLFSPEGMHLIVCVHGLDGSSGDLRLVKAYIELGLPGANLDFLMSERNQGDTFSDFEKMTDRLVTEILCYIEKSQQKPEKISFIGHSLGAVIIRSAISRPQMKHLLPKFHTYMSLSGPHLGTLYNPSGLVNMGIWLMQKLKKSTTLLQLGLRDGETTKDSFLYKLSKNCHLSHFKHVLLVGSSQDRYVPLHSARIELCRACIRDDSERGIAFKEMVQNILQPIMNKPDITFVRYDVHHVLPNTANSLIGRAAHIALLDSDLFIEKFLVVTGLKYFR